MQLVGDGDGFSWSGVYGRLGDEPLVGAACLEEGVPRLDVTDDGDGFETRAVPQRSRVDLCRASGCRANGGW
jgi:hypothetical protein